jgi:hypothetical protein
MKAIAFLHQYQREIKKVQIENKTIEYIEVTLPDIDQANRIAHEILGRSLDDLSAPSRTLLGLVQKMVLSRSQDLHIPAKDYAFTRRMIREYARWSDWQVKTHIRELEELGFVYSRMGSKGKEYVYELHYNSSLDPQGRVNLRLTEISQLKNRSGGIAPLEELGGS